MHRALGGVFLVVAAVVLTSRGVAAERRLSFSEALSIVNQNPRVVAGRAASSQLATEHRLSPSLDANPVVSGTLGPRLAPSAERGLEGSLGVTQPISLEGAA